MRGRWQSRVEVAVLVARAVAVARVVARAVARVCHRPWLYGGKHSSLKAAIC